MHFGKYSCKAVYSLVIMAIALLMGISAVFISPQYIDYLIMFSKFFEAMIPVLAVGALVKYLSCCPKGECPQCDKVAK